MKMKTGLSILFLLFMNNIIAQSITKKYLKNSQWVLNNEEDSFYKNDTLTLYQIPNDHIDKYGSNPIDILNFFGHGKSVRLKFQKNKRLQISDIYYHQHKSVPVNIWFWKFDAENQMIHFYKKKKLMNSFLIESSFTVEVPINAPNHSSMKQVLALKIIRVPQKQQ